MELNQKFQYPIFLIFYECFTPKNDLHTSKTVSKDGTGFSKAVKYDKQLIFLRFLSRQLSRSCIDLLKKICQKFVIYRDLSTSINFSPVFNGVATSFSIFISWGDVRVYSLFDFLFVLSLFLGIRNIKQSNIKILVYTHIQLRNVHF